MSRLQTAENYTSTKNPCRLCTPFGACLAYQGIAFGVPFIHGSQGCSTYIRRYMIGHFREPVDIACSNFGEATTIFGGKANFEIGIRNVIEQYRPRLIGICTTCLAETIGDDVSMFIHEFVRDHASGDLPALVHASTPSYRGTHADGFHLAVHAIVSSLARETQKHDGINLFANMLSPADFRYLNEIAEDFGAPVTLMTDYSDSLDGGVWEKYEKNIEYGTEVEAIARSGGAKASIEFSSTLESRRSGANYLLEAFGTPMYRLGIPISVRATDRYFDLMTKLTGRAVPQQHLRERGRLIDSYIDGHKYIFEKRAVVFGEEDLVVSLACFLAEIGIVPVLCATGGQSRNLRGALEDALPEMAGQMTVLEDSDFTEIEKAAIELGPDLIVGNSNGYKIQRRVDVPLIRVGMPIHDRIGASRVLHVGYRGAQQLYDRIVNAFIKIKQDDSPVGYTHI